MKHLAVLILVLLLIPSGVQALTFISGGQQVIDTPIDDDVIASGGTVTVDAPVGSLTVAGGEVTVNAPVDRDIIAAGGSVILNGNVGGKVLAAGGDVQLNGNATNALLTGGTVRIGKDAVIARDAAISGGSVTNAGTVVRNLSVSANTFDNTGTAGNVMFQQTQQQEPALPGLIYFGIFISILIIIGYYILGLILLRVFPKSFSTVVKEIDESPVVRTIIGFFAIIVSAIVITIVAVTVVGLPIAAVAGMLFIIALIISALFVSYALGAAIVSRTKWNLGVLGTFTLGFVILQILYIIPFVGFIIQVIAVSLGFGGLLYAVRTEWRPPAAKEAS
jgi:magnesium-transporting ATPase (P-type)